MSNMNLDPHRVAVRTDRLLAALASATALVVYLLTLAPTVSFWDSGEYITCAWVMGIPHPPGVPFFVLMGRFSTLIFGFIPEIAARVNLLCGLAGVVSVGLITRLVQRWCNRMRLDSGFYRPVSVTAGLLAAFSYTIWRNNNSTETYAMALMLSMIILWVFDMWLERRLRGVAAGRHLLLVGYFMAISIGNHLSTLIVVGPIALMYILYAFRGWAHEWKKPGFILAFAGLLMLAFSVHLYMPLRAIQQPEVNETNPSRFTEFRDALERKQYGQVPIFERKGPFLTQLALFGEYHSWQVGRPEAWQRALGQGGQIPGTTLWIVMSMAGLLGLVVIGARRPDLLVLVGGTFFMASFIFVTYLNFKTGPEGTLLGEVRERDYFYGAAFSFSAVLVALGGGTVIRFLGGRRSLWALLLIPMTALLVNWHFCDRSGDFVARDYGVNLLRSCAPNAVLITNGDNDTFPLWFAQGVLGERRDVVVSNLSLMNTPWYTHQLMARDPLLLSYPAPLVDSLRPVFIWGPNFFHVSSDGMPATDITDREILDLTFTGSWPWNVSAGDLCIAVPSMGLGSQGSLAMQDLLLLDMIKRVPIHGRPVYLAGTVSRENRVYIEDYLLMEGIAYRVMDTPQTSELDPERSWSLVNSYRYTGLQDPGVYKDDQAVQIARNYMGAWNALANHYLATGDPEGARLALDGGAAIFSAMPAEWMLIMPLHVYAEARLIGGVDGPEAAAGYLLAMADSLMAGHSGAGIQDFGRQLQLLSDELLQQGALLSFADSISDGTPVEEWLLIEVELAFGNFLGARARFAGVEEAFPSDPALPLMRRTLDMFTADLGSSGGIFPQETALAEVLSFMETSPEPTSQDITLRMADLASAGRPMTAACFGSVMATLYPDVGSDAASYASRILGNPDDHTRLAYWHSLASQSLPEGAVAGLCLDAGLPEVAQASGLERR